MSKVSFIEKKTEVKEAILNDTAIKTLASSIYQTLQDEGCKHNDIIGVSSQLIGLVTSSIRDDKPIKK